MFVTLSLLLSFFATVQAGCDNACSGHGACQLDGVCDCYDNWGMGLSHDSGDCSDRVCPFEISWIDTPDKYGTRHKYAECAGRGVCNRETGDCECFPGYEGKACKRAVCPNSCSGHGQCTYINDMPYQTTPHDFYNNMYGLNSNRSDFLPQAPHTFTYYGWDNEKTRGCVCDPEYGDVDCSKRMCPFGTDIMDHRDDYQNKQEYHEQNVTFTLAGTDTAQNGNTFALTFKSKLNETFTTIPIVWDHGTATTVNGGTTDFLDFSRDVKAALEGLPNGVIDQVQVETWSSHSSAVATVNIGIKFLGAAVQGKQNLLVMRHYKCGDGCTPKLSGLEVSATETKSIRETMVADYNSYECGRRGKCNYDTGICQCFAGYTGDACNTITALV